MALLLHPHFPLIFLLLLTSTLAQGQTSPRIAQQLTDTHQIAQQLAFR
jgi:hypothetical protein